MKRRFMMAMLCGVALNSATAAPVGWYDLNATWRDGSFSGRFYYDQTATPRVTQVVGTLTDIAQATPVTSVLFPEDAQPWVFMGNGRPADGVLQDAGFYLNLVDLGTTLSLNTTLDNGLYDWSADFRYYAPGQLDDSPLLSYSIAQSVPVSVPEPGSPGLLALGLPALAALRRWKRKNGKFARQETDRSQK